MGRGGRGDTVVYRCRPVLVRTYPNYCARLINDRKHKYTHVMRVRASARVIYILLSATDYLINRLLYTLWHTASPHLFV